MTLAGLIDVTFMDEPKVKVVSMRDCKDVVITNLLAILAFMVNFLLDLVDIIGVVLRLFSYFPINSHIH